MLCENAWWGKRIEELGDEDVEQASMKRPKNKKCKKKKKKKKNVFEQINDLIVNAVKNDPEITKQYNESLMKFSQPAKDQFTDLSGVKK